VKRALAGVAVACLIASAAGAAADREMRGCFVARFERFEFRDAADGATYFVVAANDEVTQRLRSMIGDSTFVAVPASVKGTTKTVAAGVGPNARYRAVIKAESVSVTEDPKLCAAN
jgi:crotonobetainyl-CoA:carnitine CoA-transferase CaiB-like acyl-CoA transferase